MGTRRSNGEGTEVFLGSDGRWHAYLSFGAKAGGKRFRKHVSGKTRGDVARKLRELQTKRDAGLVPLESSTLTLGEWLTVWLDEIASARVRTSTLQGYRTYVDGRIIPALGHVRLVRLQPEQVERFYRSCAKPGYRLDAETGVRIDQPAMSQASILQCHRILSRALKVAVQRGRVSRNVCTLVDAPSVRRQEVEPLTADEARRILVAAISVRNSARWSVALALGLRQGEALGLKWEDIDFDGGTLRVRRALQRQTGVGLVFVDPKSFAGRRTITLPKPLVTALKAQRDSQAVDRGVAGSMWEEYGLVFTQVNGRPIDPRRDWQNWKDLLQLAKVRDARLHDARHTAATLLLSQGVPARVAMQILGHSQISLTLGTYSHVAPELAEDAASRVASVLWTENAAGSDAMSDGGHSLGGPPV